MISGISKIGEWILCRIAGLEALKQAAKSFDSKWTPIRIAPLIVCAFAAMTLSVLTGHCSDPIPDESQLTTVDGKTLPFVGLEFVEGRVVFKTNDKKQPNSIPYEEVQRVRFSPAGAKSVGQTWVQLVDGSVLRGDDLTATSSTIKLATDMSELPVEFDVRFASWVLLRHQSSAQSQLPVWMELNERPPESADALAVFREEKLQWLEGSIGDIDRETVTFTVAEKIVQIKKARLEGLRYFRAKTTNFASPVCRVNLAAGSSLLVSRLESRNSSLVATLVCGLQLELRPSRLADVDFTMGRSVWLSELEPTTIDWKPLFGGGSSPEKLRQLNLPRVNQSLRGGALRLEVSDKPGVDFSFRSQSFEHGFAMPGGSKLAFGLDGKYRRLSGLVGFDPDASPSGVVALVIRGDQKELLRQELQNERRTNPVKIELDIADVSRIVIEIEYQDGRSSGDLLNLCDWQVNK